MRARYARATRDWPPKSTASSVLSSRSGGPSCSPRKRTVVPRRTCIGFAVMRTRDGALLARLDPCASMERRHEARMDFSHAQTIAPRRPDALGRQASSARGEGCDPELLHLREQRRALEPETYRRAAWSADDT